MRRAFLSHATVDKAFVEPVAEKLGRARIVVDTRSFKPGEDFRDEIRRTLDGSDTFVFFVSRQSLASVWCAFELDEAELRALRGQLRRAIAIFIDGPPDPDVLPSWLARVKAVQHTSPDQSARFLAALLSEPTAEDHPFVGRADEVQRGLRKLSGTDPAPRLLIVSGLQGVGRRSYLRALLTGALDLALGPVIVMQHAATLEDLFLESLASSTMLLRSRLEDQLTIFRDFAPERKAEEIANQLAFLAAEGTAPCIIDDGAMLDGDGRYLPEYEEVLLEFLSAPDAHLGLVHQRLPTISDRRLKQLSFSRRLSPLAPPDTRTLVNRLVRSSSLSVSGDQVAVLSDAVRGYPPAAYFVVSQVEEYGADVVLNDQARLRDYYTHAFSRYVADLALSSSEEQMLRYLASETRLSLDGLATAIGQDLEATARALRRLIDLNVIEVGDDDYSVSEPVRAAVSRLGKPLGRRWYEGAYKRLEEKFWQADALPPLSVVDATLRAGLLVGRRSEQRYESLVRPSLLVGAAEEMYHRKEYERALDYLERAEGMGRPTSALLDVKVRCCAHLRRFGEAKHALSELRQFGGRRAWYLDGFISRREGRHDVAIGKFQKAYAAGDRPVSLLRDYADSLVRLGKFGEARTMVREAIAKGRDNPFLLDLAARIEIADGSQEDAELALDELEAADSQQQLVWTRRAAFLLARRGNADAIRKAIELAEKAAGKRGAPIEAQLVLARALIAGAKWHRLKAVKGELARRNDPGLRARIGGLDCEEALKRGDWRRGERLLENLPAGSLRQSLTAQMLSLKASDYSVLPTERADAEASLERIQENPLGELYSDDTPSVD